MTVDERRARLVRRHLLAPDGRVSSVVDVARALVAIHSTDPATVYLSVHARTRDVDPSAIAHELYEERTVLRLLGMRRTLFVVPRETRPLVQTACTDQIAARERTRLEGWLAALPSVGDVSAFLAEAETVAYAAVAAAGEATTTDLVRAVPLLETRIEVGSGRWTATQSLGSRVLPHLAARGRLLRGRPRGTWISGQYRWVTTESWLGEEQRMPDVEDARAELVRRWLQANGPGTELDLRWWTGLTASAVRKALSAVGAVEVNLDGAVGFVLPDDQDEVDRLDPTAALLPTLDTTTMAWKEREWYLGPHAPMLFDRNGNAGPTVWWDGRVVGGWSQRRDGEIVYRVLEDVGSDAEAAVSLAAERLESWLGDVRVNPGFLPPFHRQLRE